MASRMHSHLNELTLPSRVGFSRQLEQKAGLRDVYDITVVLVQQYLLRGRKHAFSEP